MHIKVKRNVEPKPRFNMQVKKFLINFSKESKQFHDKRRLGVETEIPSSRSQKFLKLYNARKEGLGWCKPFVGIECDSIK